MAFGLTTNIIAGVLGAALVTGGAYVKGRGDGKEAEASRAASRTLVYLAEDRSTFRGVFATQVNATLNAVKSDLGNAATCIAMLDETDSARADFRRRLRVAMEAGRAEADALSEQLLKLAELQEDTNAGIAGAFDRLDPDITCRVYGLTDCDGDQSPAAVAYGVPHMEVREPEPE